MELVKLAYEEKELKRYCANGNILGLIDYLKTFEDQQPLLERYQKVFIDTPSTFEYPTDNVYLKQVLEGYYLYYVYVFAKLHTPKEGEAYLLNHFQEKFKLPLIKSLNLMEKWIKFKVNTEGYEFLGGTTSAYYGPYIWKTSEKRLYHVLIPAKTIRVPVFFMKDFISNSWLSFLSFGKTGTGGWTKRKGLFCKWDSYESSLDLPSFQISFLKHEAQHLYDFHRYGHKLSQSVLEYRAKLCELSYYPTSDLLEQFINTAKDDSNFAHSQAEFWVVSDLSKALFDEAYVTDRENWQSVYLKVAQIAKTLLLNNHRLKTKKS